MDKAADIKQIWRERFGDSRHWMNEVFSRVYNDRDALGLEYDGRIVSSMLLRPMTLSYRGKEMPVGYIYGAATLKQFQGRGFMSNLMVNALATARSRGMAVVMLHPSRRRLYGFYARFGFSTTLYIDEQRYTAAHIFPVDFNRVTVDDTVYDPARISRAYTRLAGARGSCLLHNENDFKTILIDNDIDRGMVSVVRDSETDEIIAFALAKSNDESIMVKELVAENHAAADAALWSFSERQPGKMTVVEVYPERNGIKFAARGMARVVDVESVLKIFAEINPHLTYRLRISDPLIAANNGLFTVDRGRVVRASHDDMLTRVDLEASIDIFTSIIFSSERIGSIFGLPTARPFASMLLG